MSSSSGLSFESFLYSKSPMALDKFKFPLTLPSLTNPPAFSILAFSPGMSGLWSIERSTGWPFLQSKVLESPELAT